MQCSLKKDRDAMAGAISYNLLLLLFFAHT